LFVSHDRYFINRIATKVFELSTDGVTEYLGDYDYYIEKKEEMIEIQKLSEENRRNQTQEPASDIDAKTRYEQEKELKKLERQKKRRIEEIETLIESLEIEIAEKEQQFLHPEIYSDHTKVAELNTEIEKAKAKIETLLEEWSELE
jgi:ATP-binding cassette subfamily F protein 3